MNSNYYLWEEDNQRGTGVFTLNRPKLHNAFNDEMIGQITKFFSALNERDDLRVIIVQANGKSFCAGADLNWMKSMKDYTKEENISDSRNLQLMFDAINNCSIPTIGVVHGAALGGGSGLVACIDYVLAYEGARFGFTEVKLGMVPAVISPFVMDKIGHNNARAYFTTGERFQADLAKQIGLVHFVGNEKQVKEKLERVVKEYLSAGPQASKLAKALAMQIARQSDHEAKAMYTRTLIADVRIGQEGQEGMSAMLEKRKPEWYCD